MGIINVLPTELSNKIAAGEVVERPASVIKELVENSIDAGATVITVEINKGGVAYMRVTDNGKGMSDEDAKICFLRHATSKIQTDEDLDAIYTLGFRGEALSSIGAVSRVSLYTRREGFEGICVKCAGGEILSSTEAGLQQGTIIIVEDLFFNTPARAKFLKKDATEAGYISDIMSRFIFAHPEISFRLIVNGKEKLFSPGDSSIKNAVCTVYGRDYAKSLIPVDYENEGVRITGVIGNSNIARPNRNYESFFVNKRYIKSPKMMNALEEAFKNQIMIGKFPMAVLNVEINPLYIDINVHPTKLEVKFSDDRLIYHTVYYGVKNALYAIPEPEEKTETAKDFLGIPTDMLKRPSTPDFNPRENPFLKRNAKTSGNNFSIGNKTDFKNTVDEVKHESIQNDPKQEFVDFMQAEIPSRIAEPAEKAEKPLEIKENHEEQKNEPQSVLLRFKQRAIEKEQAQGTLKSNNITIEQGTLNRATEPEECDELFEYFKIIGQAFDTYIIAEKDDKLIFVDQHAAHERIKYEELLEELDKKGIYSQILIEPVEIKLSGNEVGVFAEAEPELKKLGFDCNEADGVVYVSGIPGDIDMSQAEELVLELITQFGEGRHELISEVRQRLLYTVACKSAVKANHRLSEGETEALVRRVLALEKDLKKTCPHGRPITIVKTKKEIEKDFKRIV